LSESVPQVARRKLRVVLDSPGLTASQWAEATRLLAEAQRATGRREEALATLDQLDDRIDPAARLLRADILASALRWQEALAIYSELAAKKDAPDAAIIGQAESLHALGETRQAIAVLEPLVRAGEGNMIVQLRLTGLYADALERGKARAVWERIHPTRPEEQRWARYLEGRILLLDGDVTGAAACFNELVQSRQIGENLFVAATLGRSDAIAMLDGWESADKPLETFISQHQDSPWLELVFRRLDHIYSQQRGPDEDQLQKWAKKLSPRGAALARYYLARMQHRKHKAKEIETLNAFVELYPNDKLLSKVQLMRADWFLAARPRQFDQAALALDAAARSAKTDDERAEIELHTGLAHFTQREFLLAAASLDRAAERSAHLRDVAQFDAALAWLNQGNYERFFDEYRDLSNRAPDSELRGQLVLEEGLLQARQGDSRAHTTLEIFLRDFPRHDRVPEARLALSELALAEADIKNATRYIKIANDARNDAAKSGNAEDQSDYFAIFLADAQPVRDDAQIVQMARNFLLKPQNPSLLPEEAKAYLQRRQHVQMKLGQVYFRQSDFANAETQFGTLAKALPEGDYAETALFLAGQSALKLGAVERALSYFDDVAKRSGPLKLYARQQQAILQAARDKPGEALALYDIILAAQPPPELKFAAMIGKGDSLVALGRDDPKQIDAALSVFDELARTVDASAAWQNQALYKKAKALEQLNRNGDALTTYYDVLDRATREGPPNQSAEREYFWFYKAGFDAARIFEQLADWRSAIGIYEKMARLAGPRAEAARREANKIRLQKFIWE
jgi:outer membrane protein assembly factor BamD (BamD/ComL family)